MKKLSLVMMTLLALVLAVGCTKASAKEVAQGFNDSIETAPCYYTHDFISDNASMTVWRDADANVKVEYNYPDQAVKEDFYLIDETYTYYLNDELANQQYDLYAQAEMEHIVADAVDDLTFYPQNYISVFDDNVDSQARENTERNAFEASGVYEDGTDADDLSGGTEYTITYGKEGNFFELKDDFDVISIQIDDSISVALPQ